MSDKNFMSYEDAAEVLGTFAERIKDDEYENITYEQWLAKTDEQKEAGNFLVSGVPNADGKVTINGCVILWTNPDRTVEFPAQTVNLSQPRTDFDFIVIEFERDAELTTRYGSVMVAGSRPYTILHWLETSGSSRAEYHRYVDMVSDVSKITFGTEALTNNDTKCVPIKVYGLKLNQQFEIQAIARDVSTSADKCMLTSDPTKSVETMLTNFGFTVHTDWSTGSQGSGNYITISNIGGWQEFKYVTISEPGWYFVHMQCHYYLSESGVTPGYGKEMSTGIRATGNHGNLVIGSGESVGSTNNSYGMSHSYAMVYIAVADDQILCQAYAGPTGATLKVYGTVQILKLQKN